MYFFWAEGRVIKMIFYIENREKFLLFLGLELYVASASILAVGRQGQLWEQGREMNLCSGVRLGSYQLREESSSPIKKIHCGVCLHTDIISFIWRHFKLRNRRERNQWGSLGTGTLKTSHSVSCPWQLVLSWLEAVSVLGSVGSHVLAGGLIDQNI